MSSGKSTKPSPLRPRTGEIIEKMRVNGTDLIPSTPEEIRAYMESETRKWAEAIRNANIKIEQ